MQTTVHRGDVFFADLDPVFGSEQGGTRPVLVLQNDIGNCHSPTTIVAAMTCKRKPKLPTHVMVQDAPGLHGGSVVLLEQLRTIDAKRLVGKLTSLDARQMHLVDIALMTSLGMRGVLRAPMLMTLCSTCAQSFLDSDEYMLSQISSQQDAKEPCTICNIRNGFDYEVTRL